MQTKQENQQSYPSKLQSFGAKIREYFKLDQTRSTGRKIASSLWAIFFGLMAAMVFIAIVTKNNPFSFFSLLITGLQSDPKTFRQYFLVFAFAGLASALAFKGGLFNIGISGQMMISGLFSFAIFITIGKSNLSIGLLLLGLLGTLILSFLVAMIAGVLKAYLNVHEVITTILLNWIIVQISSFIFGQETPIFSAAKRSKFISTDYVGTKTGSFSITPSIEQGFSIAGFILLFVLVFAIWYILKFTTIGYKIKMLGISKTNGKYMGVNDKMLTAIIMGFSGMIAGLAGFYFFMFKEGAIYRYVDSPLAIGFEAIAISLLALNSPIGIVFTSIFYGILYNGRIYIQAAPLYLDSDYISIVTALILYFAAISQLLMSFKLGLFVWKSALLSSKKEYWARVKLHRAKLKLYSLKTKLAKKVHYISMNIKTTNQETMLAKYRMLKETYDRLIAKQELNVTHYENLLALTEKFENNLQMANYSVYKLKQEYATKIKSQKQMSKSTSNVTVVNQETLMQLQKEAIVAIADAKATRSQTIAHLKATFKEETTALNKQFEIDLDLLRKKDFKVTQIPFVLSENSNKEKIVVLEKEFNLNKDKFLTKALDYKTTDAETLENFAVIAAKNRELGAQCFALGKFAKRDIAQNHSALRKSEVTRHSIQINNLYATAMLYLKTRVPKGEMK